MSSNGLTELIEDDIQMNIHLKFAIKIYEIETFHSNGVMSKGNNPIYLPG